MAGRPGRSGGANAKPTALKIVEGNAGHRPINDAEPQFSAAAGEAPDWLDEYARELWNYIVPPMLTAGVLTVVDVPMVAAACERWSLYRRSSRRIRRTFTQRSGANGRVVMPEVAISKGALQDALAILREFGAGASSRSRIKVPPPDEKDPFEEWARKRGKA